MCAYFPENGMTLVLLGGLLLAGVITGYGLQLLDPAAKVRLRAWGLLAVGTAMAHFLTLSSPAGFRMMALIAVLFIGMKAVVAVNRRPLDPALSFANWLAFALGWPGMQPALFRKRAPQPLPGWQGSALQGLVAIGIGTGFILLSRFLWEETASLLFATVPFFIGSSLVVHFGLFKLATAFWRWNGFDCGNLFQNPFRAQNLGDFWAKRWNMGFVEMTAAAAYHPLKQSFPAWVGLVGAFGFSGILHEVAISLPVETGYGGPLAYFLLHGGLVALERKMAGMGLRLRGGIGLAWTLFWLVAPLPVLFHKPFLAGVVWPLIGAGP